MPTPAGPTPGGLIDRFLARLIDSVILFVVAFLLALILVSTSDSYLVDGFITSVLGAALYLGYFGFLESSRGQTFGKQLMKLKVVGPDGHSNPTMEQAVKRNIYQGFSLLGIIPGIGTVIGLLLGLAAAITIAVNINADTARRQHYFDTFAGGTEVLKIG